MFAIKTHLDTDTRVDEKNTATKEWRGKRCFRRRGCLMTTQNGSYVYGTPQRATGEEEEMRERSSGAEEGGAARFGSMRVEKRVTEEFRTAVSSCSGEELALSGPFSSCCWRCLRPRSDSLCRLEWTRTRVIFKLHNRNFFFLSPSQTLLSPKADMGLSTKYRHIKPKTFILFKPFPQRLNFLQSHMTSQFFSIMWLAKVSHVGVEGLIY